MESELVSLCKSAIDGVVSSEKKTKRSDFRNLWQEIRALQVCCNKFFGFLFKNSLKARKRKNRKALRFVGVINSFRNTV